MVCMSWIKILHIQYKLVFSDNSMQWSMHILTTYKIFDKLNKYCVCEKERESKNKTMASINDTYQHKCSTFTNEHSKIFSSVRSKFCGNKRHIIGHGMSNGWLHFVDLFRLSDADIERTTFVPFYSVTLVGDTVCFRFLFMRDLERFHGETTHFENEVSPAYIKKKKKSHQPICYAKQLECSLMRG